jgi:iron complex transport system substrate-binding protein
MLEATAVMVLRFALVGLLLAMAAGAVGAAEPPRRIVSFNLCADQLALALADPGQIAALSPYAADPALSTVAEAAKSFPTLGWEAEGALAVRPDLVLVGPDDRTAIRRMLQRFGLAVEEVALVTDLAAARHQIRLLAQRLGHPRRGEALVAALDAAAARLAAVRPNAPRTALVIERGGYAAGADSLVAALLALAGLHPPPQAPRGYGGFVPLETLLMLRPDVIVLKDAPTEAADQGALFLTHPALQRLYPPQRRIALPGRYTMCGGPALVAALDHLAAALGRMQIEPR